MNWIILVTDGKESNSDFLSSGERKGNSLKKDFYFFIYEIINIYAKDGFSPVIKKIIILKSFLKSNMEDNPYENIRTTL